MTIQKAVEKFITSPNYLSNGAGYLADLWDMSKKDVYEAREIAREMLHSSEKQKLNEIISDQEEMLARYMGSESSEDGVVKKFQSDKPLTPKEIEEVSGVDGINTYVARVWDKLLPNGIWTYSIDVRFRVKDFYTKDELEAKLKVLMPQLNPVEIKVAKPIEKLALVICIADDHCGAVNNSNVFPKNQKTYEERLLEVLSEISDNVFEEVHIISLGDQMNGWNSQTTRGGHEVKSVSNQEQFDIYVKGRVSFYDALFNSGMSNNYFLHDVENSNHAGLGLSYMANRALEMYINAKYPQVIRESINDIIGEFKYGEHVIMFGHGKDEKLQKRPMPYNLDAKTDLYLYDLAQQRGYSPVKNNITFYKGDLHQHGLQRGKFGRYINVPAISGNSDYGDINFGGARGGALFEIYDKESYRILSEAIWF